MGHEISIMSCVKREAIDDRRIHALVGYATTSNISGKVPKKI